MNKTRGGSSNNNYSTDKDLSDEEGAIVSSGRDPSTTNEQIASGGFAHIDSIPDENEQIELQEKSGTSMRSLKDLSVKDSESILVDDSESDMTVSVVTWNLAESSPSEEEAAFIKRFRTIRNGGSDLIMFGSQETENPKPRRTEGSRSVEIRRLLVKMLGKKYVPLVLHSLGGVQFALFCKRSILGEIEDVSIADVACGIGNVFHNKGAIGAFLQIKARNGYDANDTAVHRKKSVKLLLVACHLVSSVIIIRLRNILYFSGMWIFSKCILIIIHSNS